MQKSLLAEAVAEFAGTMVLILFGTGVVAMVVLGGLGNFMGALLASFAVAIAESLGALFMPGSTAPVLPFLLFVLVLLLRPEGLLGTRTG